MLSVVVAAAVALASVCMVCATPDGARDGARATTAYVHRNYSAVYGDGVTTSRDAFNRPVLLSRTAASSARAAAAASASFGAATALRSVFPRHNARPAALQDDAVASVPATGETAQQRQRRRAAFDTAVWREACQDPPLAVRTVDTLQPNIPVWETLFEVLGLLLDEARIDADARDAMRRGDVGVHRDAGLAVVDPSDGMVLDGVSFRDAVTAVRHARAAAAQAQALELEARRGLPARVLELGSFEGLATSWLLQRVLASPNAEVVCVDLFAGSGGDYDPPPPGVYAEAWGGSYARAFRHNTGLARSAAAGGLSAAAVTALKGTTLEVLTRMHADITGMRAGGGGVHNASGASGGHGGGSSFAPSSPSSASESFDFVYVDAGHTSFEVLQDISLAWPLLRPGGVMVLDDYLFAHWLPVHQTPRVAVDAAMRVLVSAGQAHVAHLGYQVALVKGS